MLVTAHIHPGIKTWRLERESSSGRVQGHFHFEEQERNLFGLLPDHHGPVNVLLTAPRLGRASGRKWTLRKEVFPLHSQCLYLVGIPVTVKDDHSVG